jgi:hypothetical protein
MDHLITADETDDIEVHSAWLDWTMTLSQLFNHDDAEQITKLATEIRDTNTGAFDASELLQRLEHIDEPFQSKHWIFFVTPDYAFLFGHRYLAHIFYMEKVLYKVAHCCRSSISFSTSCRCTKCTSCTTSNGSTNCTASYVPKRSKSGTSDGTYTYSDQFQKVAS